MRVLCETKRREFRVLSVLKPGEVAAAFAAPESFPCLIWDHGARFSESDRMSIAKELLAQGCRYAVCGGANADAWHLAFDLVFTDPQTYDPNGTSDHNFLMTTSHDGEAPADVAQYFVLNTNYEHFNFAKYLLVHVGNGRRRQEIEDAVTESAVADDAKFKSQD